MPAGALHSTTRSFAPSLNLSSPLLDLLFILASLLKKKTETKPLGGSLGQRRRSGCQPWLARPRWDHSFFAWCPCGGLFRSQLFGPDELVPTIYGTFFFFYFPSFKAGTVY